MSQIQEETKKLDLYLNVERTVGDNEKSESMMEYDCPHHQNAGPL
jgi:hypothetical protein